MPEWMIWAVLIWIFFAIRGRHGCGWGRARYRIRGPGHRLSRDRWHRLEWMARDTGDFALGASTRPVQPGTRPVDLRRPGARPRSPQRTRPRREKPPETREQRLQRQFVEGRLTIEEYEDRLWEEIGGGGS